MGMKKTAMDWSSLQDRPRSVDAAGRARIRSSSVPTKVVVRATREQNIYIAIS